MIGIGTSVGGVLIVHTAGNCVVWVTGVVMTHPLPSGVCMSTTCVVVQSTVCETGQESTFLAWPGVRNVTGVQSTVTLFTGARRRRRR